MISADPGLMIAAVRELWSDKKRVQQQLRVIQVHGSRNSLAGGTGARRVIQHKELASRLCIRAFSVSVVAREKLSMNAVAKTKTKK